MNLFWPHFQGCHKIFSIHSGIVQKVCKSSCWRWFLIQHNLKFCLIKRSFLFVFWRFSNPFYPLWYKRKEMDPPNSSNSSFYARFFPQVRKTRQKCSLESKSNFEIVIINFWCDGLRLMSMVTLEETGLVSLLLLALQMNFMPKCFFVSPVILSVFSTVCDDFRTEKFSSATSPSSVTQISLGGGEPAL